MFDKKEYDIPLDLMSTIDGTVNRRKALVKEPKLHFTSLTNDKRFFKIKYEFIKGDHEPTSLNQCFEHTG